MRWRSDAENRLKKVPFFVRKKVRKEVEKEAQNQNSDVVNVQHLEVCRQRYMNGHEDQSRGYEIDQCFGADKCPNRVVEFGTLHGRMERLLEEKKLGRFLKQTISGPVKMHHVFRVSVSGCPNSCSRPQIVDFGLTGAAVVEVTSEECSGCGMCFTTCREKGLVPDRDTGRPVLDPRLCLRCGVCAEACTTGTLKVVSRGFRIMLGGRLGRHPQLADELDGIWTHDQVLDVLGKIVDHFKENNCGGERLRDIINRTGMDFLRL